MRAGRLVTVALAGFEPIFALGLAAMLDGDERLEVVARDVEVEELEMAVRRLAPCVVVLAGPEPHLLRVSLAPLLDGAGILVLASAPTLAYERLVSDAGALCIESGAPLRDVLDAVHCVAGTRGAADSFFAEASQRSAVRLTRRERDVLVCISEGKTHKETARDLNIGLRTVHTYSERLCRKFSVRSKRELARMRNIVRTVDK
jgi:DNA-binding NarL/FixJ family response regulator